MTPKQMQRRIKELYKMKGKTFAEKIEINREIIFTTISLHSHCKIDSCGNSKKYQKKIR